MSLFRSGWLGDTPPARTPSPDQAERQSDLTEDDHQPAPFPADSQPLQATQDILQDAVVEQNPFQSSPLSTSIHQPWLFPLAAEIFDVAKKQNPEALDGYSLQTWYLITLPVLASMAVPVLRELVEGNLAKASLSGAVKETVDTYRHNCEYRPGIYTMIIADAHGNAPSPKELLKVIKVVRMYCKQGSDADKVAREVDSRMPSRQASIVSTLPRCHRRYLMQQNSDRDVSEAKVERVRSLCDTLKKRLKALPTDEQTQPLKRPLHYFGWAVNLRSQISNHERHLQSNEISCLFHAVLMYIFDRSLTQRRGFTLFGLPLCFLTKPIQSSLAEIMFTVMGNGYASNGTGFNSEPTDENNDSANQIDQRIWANNTGCVYLTTPLNLNMENETIHLEIVSSRQPGDEEIPPDYLLQYLRTKLEAILQMPDESDNWPEELMESSEEVSKLDQAEQEQDMRREREIQDLVAKVDELEKALEGLL